MQQPSQRLYFLYHELRPGGSRYSYVLSTEQFEQHIDLFARLQHTPGQSLRPEVTFDDGHISNFEYALPILEAKKLRATFFITVGWTGQRPGYMGWPELQALHKAGHRIGAHGWTHTLLTHCNPQQLLTELQTARLTLEDKLGVPVTTMSLPGGRSNRRVLTACQSAGYTQIYTSVPRPISDPTASTIGRLNVRGDMTPQFLAALLQPQSPTLRSIERQHRIKESAKSLLGDRIYERLWALLNRKEPQDDAEEASGA